jgi:hypothetical protein
MFRSGYKIAIRTGLKALRNKALQKGIASELIYNWLALAGTLKARLFETATSVGLWD